MEKRQPNIWVLLGARAGDNAQALELARRLDGVVRPQQLHFNRRADLPNWLAGTGFRTLTAQSAQALAAPWPDIIIATGRRAAPVSLAIKQASGGRALAIHIGRPRLPLAQFDLLLTTPQYGLPPDGNVIELAFPFAVAREVSEPVLEHFRSLWSHLPRPWIVAVIGAAKFPVRLGTAEIDGFAEGLNALAQRSHGSLILMDSPRSSPDAIARLSAGISVPHWQWTRGQGDNPYQAALRLADQLAVTSDSVSMIAEMVQTGKSAHVYQLPVFPLLPHWRARTGLAAVLARSGLLSPPRSVAAYFAQLALRGWTGNLNAGTAPPATFVASGEHSAAVQRILTLWRSRATD